MLRNRAKCALKFQEALIRINFIGFFLAFIAQGSADPIYMAFAPKMIRPSRPYNISLLVQNSSRPISVELELVESITKVDGTPQLKTHISTEAVLQPNSQVSQVSFTAPDSLLPGDYKLKIRGSDGGSFKFENETDLSYDGKSKSIFVQSDKAIYKPGDKVRFRVIIVDPDLKPYAGVADIYVHDPDGNRIHQWLGISEAKVNGVYSREVQLSADPMLGDWKITVIARGEKLDKFFTVQEYVLPKFEVKLKLPPFALIDDKTVDFDVRAEYTYGKAVEGQLKVTAEKYPDYNFPKAEHTTKQSKFKGVHSVSLPMSQLVNYEEFISQGSIAIEATVTDKLTGIAQTATGNIVIYKYPIKIIVEKTSETFKPGLKYTAFIKVLTHDDRPVTKWPAKINVTISGGNENEPELFETHNLYPVPSNGVIEIVTYPSRNLTNLWLRASLPDNDEPYINIDAASSRSRNFLQAVAVNDVALPAQDLALVLNCTEALHTVSYTVLSRGSIVASGNWNLNGKTTDKVFIRVTSEMAPKARILVSYIREDGEVVADSFDLDANGLFRNQVTLSVKAKQRQEYAMPGEDAVIRVSSSPDSYVALLGVDQSVLLLKDGNDITQEMVKDEIAGYSTTFDNDMWGGPWGRGVPFRRRKRSMYFGFSSSDAQDVIENAGLIVLTNAYVHDQDMYLGRQFDSGELMFEAMPVPRLGTGRVVNNLVSHKVEVAVLALT